MSGSNVRFRTPWLDLDPGSRRPPSTRRPGKDAAEIPARESFVPEGRSQAQTHRPHWVTAAFAACGVLAILGVVNGPIGGNSNVTGALVMASVLLAITVVIARRIAAADKNPALAHIIIGGFCLKLVASVLRYRIASDVYGTGDFFEYHKWGVRIAEGLQHGNYISPPGRLAGTNFVRLVTGVIYTVTPRELMAGFVVYGWISFIGLLFFWRAYRVAISSKRDVTYLKWVVLLPSLMYWPSAIGKDAFMVLGMGVTSYGAACLLSNRLAAGVPAISLGFVAMCMVRPHIALVASGGLLLASVVKRSRGNGGRQFVGVIFAALSGLIIIQTASSFFGIDTLNRDSVQQQITETSVQTADGGSEFSPVQVNSPVDFPLAAITVLYRPMPLEANSTQVVLTSIEDIGLAVLTLLSLRRILVAVRHSRDYPYFMYCIGALLVFIIAFSGFSNFGLLARQRAVIQPLLLVFLSLPKDTEGFLRGRDRGPNRTTSAAPRRAAAGARVPRVPAVP